MTQFAYKETYLYNYLCTGFFFLTKKYTMTNEEILKLLSKVHGAEGEKNIVLLNYVDAVKIEGKNIFISLSLPMTASPQKAKINEDATQLIKETFGNEVEAHINFSVRSTGSPATKRTVLPDIKNIIAVVSGKGGVGKSTVASNLALALAQQENKVGLMDADIYGPSIPIMFGIRGQRPMMVNKGENGMIVPIEKYGIKLMSIGLLIDEKQAVVWRGPMASSAIRQFTTDVDWGELDYLVIDMPPGTGDIHLTLMQLVPVSGVVIVTTPQDVALADAKKGIAMFGQSQINVPILGLVENMAYFTPAELPGNKYYLFGKEGGKKLASEYDLNLLGEIPLVQSICEGGDAGVPIMMSEENITKKAFEELAKNVVKNLSHTKA
ncbi:MAG: Mrp/NBP35 family ATP-binding protein [Chitinophagaceae bacterium]|jgi:ATP-binding protein involved in chromosome partitioning|nr:Mrp/NBP35 family ATP-binding protein [Chitinophagaceae bacterium]